MNCACKDPNCKTTIGVDTASGMVLVDMNLEDNNRHVGFYLDPNLAMALIRQLRQYLLDAVNQ